LLLFPGRKGVKGIFKIPRVLQKVPLLANPGAGFKLSSLDLSKPAVKAFFVLGA
jgi:hypothetical protein